MDSGGVTQSLLIKLSRLVELVKGRAGSLGRGEWPLSNLDAFAANRCLGTVLSLGELLPNSKCALLWLPLIGGSGPRSGSSIGCRMTLLGPLGASRAPARNGFGFVCDVFDLTDVPEFGFAS